METINFQMKTQFVVLIWSDASPWVNFGEIFNEIWYFGNKALRSYKIFVLQSALINSFRFSQ